MAQDSRVLLTEEVWLLRKLKQHCLVLASLERIVARLRSRIHYLGDDDANTKFLRLQARLRKKRNFISQFSVLPLFEGSFAKLVTRMLANGLGPHLQELVETNQSAFVRGRSIHDNLMSV
jgi:hypothetical protein